MHWLDDSKQQQVSVNPRRLAWANNIVDSKFGGQEQEPLDAQAV
jgi:hypothetical protein